MSQKYSGGFITKSPVAPTTSAASGIWTLDQQQQAKQAGNWPSPPIFIEDLFSTYLYTGNGSTQTITNGIDLSTNGGLVWIKSRSNTEFHRIFDTARGVNKSLSSNSTNAQNTAVNTVTAFNTTGFSLGDDSDGNGTNTNADTYVSWTFRKQPKFFDVVTWTGNDAANRQISHSLGSVPGCIIVKRTDTSATWRVWHQNMVSNSANLYLNQLNLNTTDEVNLTYGEVWGTSNNVTSTTFQVGNLAAVNGSGGTYVAYVFAHNAGGFGLTGTDNVISCGSYVGNGSANGPVINLGYEPQWVMIKHSSGANNWELYDNMRGVATGGNDALLRPNTSGAEEGTSNILSFTSTGFQLTDTFSNTNGSGETYIYIAIRRGPMKVPTSGTSVFNTKLRTGTDVATTISGVGFPTDLVFSKTRTPSGNNPSGVDFDRLRGIKQLLTIESTVAEYTKDPPMSAFTQDGYSFIAGANDPNLSGYTYCDWNFRRAPSFFDVVCYTGTGVSSQTFNHNLGVVPELMIVKCRSQAAGGGWVVYSQALGNNSAIILNSTGASFTPAAYWNTTSPTASVFSVNADTDVGNTGRTYVNYLFATCAGVSKVGTYTGTGALLTVNCGFTAGARFVLIKRTDSTGDWYVWDSARGIVSGNDPYLLLNSTAAEVTNTDYVDTYSAGFEISSTAPAAINASAGSFIFLAIA